MLTHRLHRTVGGGGYGQNLAAYGSSGAVATFSPALMLAKAITTQWYYGEVKNFLPAYYGRATPDLAKFAGYGHFTQLVWSGSATVGCASRFCAAGTIFSGVGSWFTVCNYVAPGTPPLLSLLSCVCVCTCGEVKIF